jgi:hypothetical protein
MTIQNSLSALLKSKQVNHITIRERLKIMNIKALVCNGDPSDRWFWCGAGR